MCLLSYADNKNAVAQIGDENREGGYTIFPRKLKSKKKKILLDILKWITDRFKWITDLFKWIEDIFKPFNIYL